MKTLYANADGGGRTPMPHLGYDPGKHDLIVAAVHSKLNMFTRDEGDSLKIWGWDAKALGDEERFRIEQLIKVFLYQEGRILSALRRLDGETEAIINADQEAAAAKPAPAKGGSSEDEDEDDAGGWSRLPPGRIGDFLHTLNVRAARPVLDAWLSAQAALIEKQLGRSLTDEEQAEIAESAAQSWERTRESPPSVDEALTWYVVAKMIEAGKELALDDDGFGEGSLPVNLPSRRDERSRTPLSLIDFTDPDVARNIGTVRSLSQAGITFSGEHWRLEDKAYGPDVVPDAEVRDLVDLVLAVQAEFQLQALLLDREFTRVIDTRGQEFEYLKAVAAAEAAKEKEGGFWGILGDVLGIISAVSGVLALIPVLTPIMGPIAMISSVAALGAHTVDAALKGDWDVTTFAELGADALGALPFVGAVAKGVRAGTTAMKTVGKAGAAMRAGSKAFMAAAGGVAASHASAPFKYLGSQGAKLVGTTTKSGRVAGKVIQGAVELTTQVPTVIELAAGADMDTSKKVGTAGEILTGSANAGGARVGEWIEVGLRARRGGTTSLARFARAWA
ncbi:hypothetical protein ACIO3O_39240 [Streptomyces sp. NPDC087440]|uniref:hypothetical protein n=1 Tax=Streptomyces sp. NPDC087440 TaxID=3365790 RepID=UPI00381E737B